MVGRRHALAAFDQRPDFTPAIKDGLQTFEHFKPSLSPPIREREPAPCAARVSGNWTPLSIAAIPATAERAIASKRLSIEVVICADHGRFVQQLSGGVPVRSTNMCSQVRIFHHLRQFCAKSGFVRSEAHTSELQSLMPIA